MSSHVRQENGETDITSFMLGLGVKVFHNLQRPRLRAAFAAKLSSWRSKLKAQGWSRGAAQHYAELAMRPLSHFMVASRIAAL